MITGDYEGSIGCAADALNRVGGVLPAVIMAKSLSRLGDIDRAEEFAAMAGKETVHELDGAWIDEILKVRAGIAYAKGCIDDCLSLLMEAWAAAPEFRRKTLTALAGEIRAGRTVRFRIRRPCSS